MNIIKNLLVNVKSKILNNKMVCILVVGTTIGTAATFFGISKANAKNKYNQNASIVAYYGEESIENEITEYINISEKLYKLNLRSFDIDESLYQKHNISNKLKSPEEIDKYIKKIEQTDSNISSKDISKQSEHIDIVLNLTMQEKLVNTYIYNVGYEVSNKNITSSTKKYTAEVFGIKKPSDVYLYYYPDNSGESNVRIINRSDTKEKTYNFVQLFSKKELDTIQRGVISMIDTQTSDDENLEDNESYNKNRNDNIREALVNSVELEKQVKDYNLYNEKLANKMK